MTSADVLTVEYHTGYREQFTDVLYTLDGEYLRVRGGTAGERNIRQFEVFDVQAQRKGGRR